MTPLPLKGPRPPGKERGPPKVVKQVLVVQLGLRMGHLKGNGYI